MENNIIVHDNFAEIELKDGLSARVSLEDLPLVRDYTWRLRIGKLGHAYTYTYIDGKYVAMHRALLNAPKTMWVDHKDGDGLNNTRENIRLCTPAQNMANKAVERRNSLGLKGVWLSNGKYRASIKPNGKTVGLGTYSTKEEAAAAYRGAAIMAWGDFAKDAPK